jgi:copper chaperone NosL
MRIFKILSALAVIVFVTGCSIEPEPINFGKDHCVYCKMTISDPKYGAELVTEKGRIYKFDAIECMLPYMKENAETEFGYTMAVAYDAPEKLQNVDSLYFVKDEHFKSPMGKNLAAFVKKPQEFESLNWPQLKDNFY